MENIKFKVEWVDLTEDDPKITIEVVDEEKLENLCYQDAIGIIHINNWGRC